MRWTGFPGAHTVAAMNRNGEKNGGGLPAFLL
jgi:hypothetical protein